MHQSWKRHFPGDAEEEKQLAYAKTETVTDERKLLQAAKRS
jgi:hypothetical protein